MASSFIVITQTGNEHKPPQKLQTTTNHQQTTTNQQQTTTNDHKRLQSVNKRLQATYKRILTTSKRPQTSTPCTLNQKSDVRFLLPASDNYKEHADREKHSLQCQIILCVCVWKGRGLRKRGADRNVLI